MLFVYPYDTLQMLLKQLKSAEMMRIFHTNEERLYSGYYTVSLRGV